MEIIELKEHDILLIRPPGDVSDEASEHAHAVLRSVLPDHVLTLLLPQEYDVSILRPYE